MKKTSAPASVFEQSSIWKILFQIAPPVMLAQLIQALYNIVDSFFVGRFSGDGLTALSVIFPIQLIITAIAAGTGVGVNTAMSHDYTYSDQVAAENTAGARTALAVLSWLLFAVVSVVLMKPYAAISASSFQAVGYAVTYGTIVCVGSLGIFLESVWTKVHQAGGNMRLPMIAQISGAVTNIILDPILIFGAGPVPALGAAGAAYATVAGQVLAVIITASGFHRPPRRKELAACAKKIYALGFPSILMQMLYTVYIVALNVILAGFSDQAVTVLGLYYKLQSFFFIPLSGLQTCIVPLLSYTYAQENYQRCRKILWDCIFLSMGFMLVGTACFELLPGALLSLFASDAEVIRIGTVAFRMIGISFLPAVVSLMMPVFFQAIGGAASSALLSLIRQIFCLVPIFWLLSQIGLSHVWLAFPLSKVIAAGLGLWLYLRQTSRWNVPAKKRL